MRRKPTRYDILGRPIAPQPDTTTRRLATCRCGQARAITTGDPLRVAVCHSPESQRRSGSAFTVDAHFNEDRVSLDGLFSRWSAMNGDGTTSVYRFCSTCGSTLAYSNDARAGEVVIPVGAFADRSFPAPTVSTWEDARQPWVAITGNVEHRD
ncbi:aldehyde-activating protein [Nostoc sp. 3335mG]|nr:aldehyde-activating protein [Nostoc sp. 3335mG]